MGGQFLLTRQLAKLLAAPEEGPDWQSTISEAQERQLLGDIAVNNIFSETAGLCVKSPGF